MMTNWLTNYHHNYLKKSLAETEDWLNESDRTIFGAYALFSLAVSAIAVGAFLDHFGLIPYAGPISFALCIIILLTSHYTRRTTPITERATAITYASIIILITILGSLAALSTLTTLTIIAATLIGPIFTLAYLLILNRLP